MGRPKGSKNKKTKVQGQEQLQAQEKPVKKRRTRYIAPITKSFIKMSNKHLGIEEGVIFTPFALSDEQVKTIEEAISQKENKTITLRTVEDKTLIGGVKVQIENRVYDGSLKNKVSKLKTELLRK